MDNQEFTINILLNGVRMPLTIPRKDEVLYRNAEKLVKRYLEKYRTDYSQRSMEEILTIVAFQIAVIVAKQSSFENQLPLVEKIMELNKELKELANKQ